jgi:hypothetical protein
MAEKPKRKPPPKRKMTKTEQFERFKEAAQKHGVDETGQAFERAFRRIAPPKWRSNEGSEEGQS